MLERRFDSFVRIYLPYMCDDRRFDTRKVDEILARCGIRCPEVDYDMFTRCIDYAVSCEWKSPQESL